MHNQLPLQLYVNDWPQEEEIYTTILPITVRWCDEINPRRDPKILEHGINMDTNTSPEDAPCNHKKYER